MVLPMRWMILLTVLLPVAAGAASPADEAKTIISQQCSACHRVPGVPGAVGDMGPSLAGMARRQTIAGKLPNNPANMIRWLMHPQKEVPGTSMPDMGLTQDQAGKIAAYLSTLDKQ